MKDYRNSFPYLSNNPNEIYFDSAATSLKPMSVIKAESEYLEKFGANPHTTDFSNAYKGTEILKKVRIKASKFIGAKNSDEVIFTKGATESLNQIAFGIKHLLKNGDEVLLTYLEHSSNIAPWIALKEEIGIKINYLSLEEDGKISIENLKKIITSKTKVISFASTSNTTGTKNDVKNIVKEIRKLNKNIIIVLDAAQSVAHEKLDIEKLDIDFVVFSAHKMYGPFGVGVLWGKMNLLETLKPLNYGGGSVQKIFKDEMILKKIPAKLEAGTPNISGIYAFGSAIDFINEIGIENIQKKELDLKKYIHKKINNLKNKNVVFYNANSTEPILIFSVNNVDCQDIGSYLSIKYNISVRTGEFCAKLINNVISTSKAIRVSLAMFNTEKEIDILFEALELTSAWSEIII